MVPFRILCASCVAAASFLDGSAAWAEELPWKKTTDAAMGISFEMPGDPKSAKQRAGREELSWSLDLDNGNTAYRVRAMEITNPAFKNNLAGFFDAARDAAIKSLKGKLLDEEEIALDGHPGRETLIKAPNDITIRERTFIVGTQAVQLAVVVGPQSKAGPADINRFLKSLAIGKPAAGKVAAFSHLDFVDAVDAKDGEKIYAAMHPNLQKLVDPPVLQLILEIVGEDLGRVKQKTTDDLAESKDEVDGLPVFRSQGTTVFEKGKTQLRTALAGGKLVGFNIDVSKLEDMNAKLYGHMLAKVVKQKDIKKGTEVFRIRCEDFLEKWFQEGEKKAWDSLHPQVQKGLPFEQAQPVMKRIREKYGPVKDVEFDGFAAVNNAEEKFDRWNLTFKVIPEKGSEVQAEITLQVLAMQAVITSFNFTQEIKPAKAEAPPEAPRETPPAKVPKLPAPPKTPAPPKPPTVPPPRTN